MRITVMRGHLPPDVICVRPEDVALVESAADLVVPSFVRIYGHLQRVTLRDGRQFWRDPTWDDE